MEKQNISLFIPFYNEDDIAEEVVSEVMNYVDNLNRDYELVLVDDGSEDSTVDILRDFSNREEVSVVIHEENRGYGNALKTGFEVSSNPLVAYMDGDGQFDINELDKLLEEVEENDIIAGIRRERADSFSRKIIGSGFNSIVRTVFNIEYRDIDCGLKIVRQEVLQDIDLKTDRTVDAELLVKADKKGFEIKQVEVSHFERSEGESEAEGLIGVRTGLILTSLKEIMEIRRDLI